MAALKCMFWNVRNLTLRKTRPGRQGGMMDHAQRINTICRLMRVYDVAILLETGVSPVDIEIENRIGVRLNEHNIIVTPQNAGETYTIAIHKRLHITRSGFFGLSVHNQHPVRQGFYFDINNLFRLCVIHAQSPALGIQHRTHILTTAVQDLLALPNANLIDHVFLGDLNFKENEQGLLDGCFYPNFIHQGPNTQILDANNPPQVIRSYTSLKTFKTIVRDSDSDSQPYDQVWFKSGFNSQIQKIEVSISKNIYPLIMDVNRRFVEHNFLNKIIESCILIQKTTIPAQYNLRNNNVQIPQEYNDRLPLLDNMNALFVILNSIKRKNPVILWPDEKLKEVITALRLVIKTLNHHGLILLGPNINNNLMDFVITRNFNGIPITKAVFDDLLEAISSLCDDLNILDEYIILMTSGEAGGAILNTAYFEYGLSDHLPVDFTIHI